MTRLMIGRAAFSAAVVLALGFGVRAAAAEPATNRARLICLKTTDCVGYCPFGAVGRCVAGQCQCVYP